MLAGLGVLKRQHEEEEEEEAIFETIDTRTFHEALGASQQTGSRSDFAVQSKDGAEPACAARGGQRLARVEVGTVGPPHHSSEVITIRSAEVGRPREQLEITSVEGSISSVPGQHSDGAAVFLDL